MRKFLFFIAFLLFGIIVNAQISKMFFVSGGISLLSDVVITPGKIDSKPGYDMDYQHIQLNYTTLLMSGRMNVVNLGESSTISLNVVPAISIGMAYKVFDGGSWYSFGANVPAFVEYNFGTASRYQAKNDYGFVLGAGYEYNIYPIVAYPVSQTEITTSEYQKIWKQPVFEFGFRHYNKKNRVKEVNFKVGYGDKGKEFTNFDGNTKNEKQAMSFRLSFLRILNY